MRRKLIILLVAAFSAGCYATEAVTDSVLVAEALDGNKHKTVKKGKKHGWGWMKGYLDGNTAGEAWGFEFHAKKDRRLVLDKVGFFYCDGDSQMTSMKFRVNVYDMSAVEGSMSDKFVNVLPAPICFGYTLGDKRSGRFEYRLTEPVVLPRDAMVEIEFLENLGSEKLYYKCNLVGKQSWGKDASDDYWFKQPFASPFFVECIEVKATDD